VLNDHETPECRCLKCNQTFTGALETTESGPPQPGAISVCISCGAVMIFGEDLKVREFTDSEVSELLADHETMRYLQNAVSVVHILKHQRN
jgi:NAD-dependent SIR2 family protein deacetylase